MNLPALFRKKTISQIQKQTAAGGEDGHPPLAKHLGARDLTAFGIAAIIGAGIFSAIGNASADGGPAVIFLYIFTALACGFAAFAYAEFASMVPVSGSAYTYSYVAFGELIAWIIGWALIMEYAVGNIWVAVSWSDYFTGLLGSLNVGSFNGIHIPEWASIDYTSAKNHFQTASLALADGTALSDIPANVQVGYQAWMNAPTLGGFHIILDIPAILIIIFITSLVYRGIKETRNASNAMVIIKLSVVLLVIIVGAFHINYENWSPFMPNGVGGVLKGVSAVFFAYIGFDAISTTAEECKNPERDLPKGIMNAIIICTILYILIVLVLTGMVSYKELAVGDPLAYVFGKLDMTWFSGIIGISAVVAMTGVLLVYQMGQPRIWMSMSRDGLLPKKFSTVHKKFQTPSFSTVMVGFVVAVPTLFIPSEEVLNLCSMGTLFAFTLVCAGVLKLQNDPDRPPGKFRTPYINGKFIVPGMVILAAVLVYIYGKDWFSNFIDWQSWSNDKDKVPMYLFVGICILMAQESFRKNLSLIPVLGLIFCFYMMAQIPLSSWIGFIIWLVIGLIIYFSFGIKNSKLNKASL